MILFSPLVLILCGCGADTARPLTADEVKSSAADASEFGAVDASEPDVVANTEPIAEQAEIVESLQAAYKTAYDEFRTTIASAESAEEKQKLEQTRPTIGDYSADMMAAIETDVKSKAAFSGLMWLYEKTKRTDKQTAEKYRTVIMEHHYTRKGIGGVANWIAYADKSSTTEQHLLKILENNKHDTDKAQTVLSLIKHYQALKAIQTDSVTRGYAEKDLGEEGMKYVDSRNREELNQLIDKYFELGMAKYGELKQGRGTFAERLAPYHFEHTRLQIGMKVPDISGEDIDGVEFKLSDYEGKVVMIDFWGDW